MVASRGAAVPPEAGAPSRLFSRLFNQASFRLQTQVIRLVHALSMDSVLTSLALGFGLAFSESGLGLGMVVPGETGVVVLAATMTSTPAVIALAIAVACGACLGDHVGYGLGLRYGDRMRDSKLVARVGRRHFDRATELLNRHGGRAVFLTRLVPIIRTLTPAAAGASRLEYRRFLPASLAGSMLWAAAYVGGGSVVAAASQWAHQLLGRAAWIALVLIVLAVLPVMIIRMVVAVRPEIALPDVEGFEARRSGRTRAPKFSSALLGEFRIDQRESSPPEFVTR